MRVFAPCWLSVLLLLSAYSASATEAEDSSNVFQDHLLRGGPCIYCPKLVILPRGRFMMGAFPWEGQDDERGPDNKPFRVYLIQPLALSVTEVTRKQYQAFSQASPSDQLGGDCSGVVEGSFMARIEKGWLQPGFKQALDHPVVCITWHQAQAYTQWLSKITGQRYRLPTEAEWEYAARAGSLTRYWWGDRIGSGFANCLQPLCGEEYLATAPVASMKPNRFGLHHMLGNVWEWVADCYQPGAYQSHAEDYPKAVTGPDNCKRVIRGGSWTEGGWSLRTANREPWIANRGLNDIGFRVVREGSDLPL